MQRIRKRLTKNQKEYLKQIRRIRRIAVPLLKKGAILPESFSLTLPKRVTKNEIARLKAIKPKTIKYSAEFIVDGEMQTFEQFNALTNNSTIASDKVDRLIVQNVLDELRMFGNLGVYLTQWILGLEQKYGTHKLVSTIQNMPRTFSDSMVAYQDYKQAVEEFQLTMLNNLGASKEEKMNAEVIADENTVWEDI